MNVASSTSIGKGYLLTALAVAVLLFASSGTAWAQTIRFDRSSGTLQEGASANPATPEPLKVTISRTGIFDSADTSDDEESAPDTTFADYTGAQIEIEVDYNGEDLDAGDGFTVTARSGDAAAVEITTGTSTALTFGADTSTRDDRATRIELTIENTTPDNGDWNEEALVLKLKSTAALDAHVARKDGVIVGTRELTVRITDDDPTPQFRFGKRDIQLATGNKQTVTVGVGSGAGGAGRLSGPIQGTLAARTGTGAETGDDVLLSVSPADAVGRIIRIYKGTDPTADGANLDPDGQGRYVVSKIGGTEGVVPESTGTTDGIMLTIEAIDVSGFRDEQISLTLSDGRTEAEKTGEGGPIEDSVPATITVLSGEETPTVKFSKAEIRLDEGTSETLHILADTDQGDQVGSVRVQIRGDATISVEQGGSPISGGTVQFGGDANAELTIRSLMSPSLEDGEEASATITITDASGANIGDPRTLSVTVVGITAVPALPLLGQLLLALFLAAGGARWYRRRQ